MMCSRQSYFLYSHDDYPLKYNFKKSITKGFYIIFIQTVKFFSTV